MSIKAIIILFFVLLSTAIVPEGFAVFGYEVSGGTKSIAQAGHIDPKVLDLGLRAYSCVAKKGLAAKNSTLTIIDYSKPSNQKRMYIVDMNKKKVTSEQLVAHGSGSGYKKATKFSNKNGSHQSSLGVFLTGNTYIGKNGLSLRLKGLEKGINDRALSRSIVIHGASYVSDSYAKRNGRVGRSWGCPALDKRYAKTTINKLKGGSVVLAYYPDKKWLKSSKYLNC